MVTWLEVEILKHENNATNTTTNNLTKKQQWPMLVNGNTKNGSQASIVERALRYYLRISAYIILGSI